MFKNFSPAAVGVSGHQSEILELVLTFGFAGIDVNMAEFATRVRLKGAAYARRLLDSARIRIGTFALPVECDADDETFQKDLKQLAEYAGYAAELGCTRTTSLLAPAGDNRPYHENFEFYRHRLQEICAVLKPTGVRLALGFQAAESSRQNHAFQFIHDLDALTLLVNMVASPDLGLLVDTWDIVAAGGSAETIRKLSADQIVAVYVAEMPAGVAAPDLDEKARLLPGVENGQVDVAAFLTILREMGYDGPVTVKPSRAIFQSRRREVIAKQVAESLDKVWRAAGLPSTMRPPVAAAQN